MNTRTSPLSCVVLAGGGSQRLGRDKLTEPLGRRTLLQHTVTRAMRIARDVVVVVAPGRNPVELHLPRRVRVVHDPLPNQGPLMGLVTGLRYAKAACAVAVGGDMPFLDPALLRGLALRLPGYQAVVPRTAEGLHPLHAVYARSALEVVDGVFRQGQRALQDALQSLRVCYVDLPCDEETRRSLFSVNTLAELEWAVSALRHIP